MYAVELDQSKRLLVISASQRVTGEQAKLAAQRVRELLQDVAPGFRVLADFRSLDSMDSAAARHIAEIMDALAEKGVASVTRVMPDPHKDIGLNILSQFHYGPEIQIATFQRLADATPKYGGRSFFLDLVARALGFVSLGLLFIACYLACDRTFCGPRT